MNTSVFFSDILATAIVIPGILCVSFRSAVNYE